MDKDLLKEYIAKHRDLIDNYQVMDVYKNIHGYFDEECEGDSADEAFSYICSGWIKCGYNPLEKMEFVPNQYFAHITTPKVVIPSNIYSIHAGAFDNVEFDTVLIDVGVRYISTLAFNECDINLVDIKCPFINIENNAFWHTSIKRINVHRSANLDPYWCQKHENVVDSIVQLNG